MLVDSPTASSIQKFKLHNSRGTEVEILNLGAILHSWKVRKKTGELQEIVVGPDRPEDYLKPFNSIPYYFGASIGRYAGRIRKGFQLNDQWYPLESDEHGVHLHGGPKGIDRKIWTLDEESSQLPSSLSLYCSSDAGEGGYPGRLEIEARYRLHDDDALEIEYRAVTDADTFLNLTNHVYFNLDGHSLTQHALQLVASRILETNPQLLPSGRFLPAAKSGLNYGQLKKLDRLPSHGGLDHCFVLDPHQEQDQVLAYRSDQAELEIRAWTNQPSVVVFAPEHLDVEIDLKRNQTPYPSICFEFQNLPDAPNHPQFPSALLSKGEVYRNWSRFQLRHL